MAEALPTPRPEPAAAQPARRPRRILRRVGKALAIVLGLLVVVLLAAGLWLRSEIRSSLPQLDGERAIPGLAAPVAIERDGQGVTTIRAANRRDVARALGFLHGQDRFFQMDLMRRSAAGELSELFGPMALDVDRQVRIHRFRETARRVLARGAPEERALLTAYAEGVNAGLAGLAAKPFEYVPLRLSPAPWTPEDSVLVAYAMFLDLQDESGRLESDLGVMADVLPRELSEFLAATGTEWEAPIVGGPLPRPAIPGPEAFNLRTQPPATRAARRTAPAWSDEEPAAALGSNNWAVAGTHTADGRALVANDMHLGIRVPNTWYRASLVWPGEDGAEHLITGVTLPGTPAMVVGSTGSIAWGFTNSYGDWHDLVILETDPNDPEVYLTPAGRRRFTHHTERIRVKGQDDATVDVRETVWGPVLDEDHRGRPRAFAWTAHYPEAVNFGMLRLESAKTVDDAVAIANVSGPPAQNFVVGDSTGRIAWTIIGRMPRRVGFDGRVPTSWADGTRGWQGWLAPEEMPRVIDPPSGRIWTANARVVDGDMLAKLGNGGYDLGARARQIRDRLLAVDKATPQDMLAIQLDDRAVFMAHWRELLLQTLTPEAVKADPRRAELRRLVEQTWTGRASVDSVAYRAARVFHSKLAEQAIGALIAPCEQADERFRKGPSFNLEPALWALVTERPAHLLDPRFRTWDEQLLSAVDALFEEWKPLGPNLAERTWGERNTTRIGHPLGGAIPFAGRWLNVPARQLPGDQDMPRVQGPAFGASERLVVSPGQEEKGFFHMPVGQSGHPMSPFYQAGHKAWEDGTPTPFLPGKTEHTLQLVPAK